MESRGLGYVQKELLPTASLGFGQNLSAAINQADGRRVVNKAEGAVGERRCFGYSRSHLLLVCERNPNGFTAKRGRQCAIAAVESVLSAHGGHGDTARAELAMASRLGHRRPPGRSPLPRALRHRRLQQRMPGNGRGKFAVGGNALVVSSTTSSECVANPAW